MTLGWSAQPCERPTMNVVSLILGSVYATVMHHVKADGINDEEDLLPLSSPVLTNPPKLSFSKTHKHILQLEAML
eukprot:scaffold1677_cov122-Cylindrotheca_fusiformis.AAC.6